LASQEFFTLAAERLNTNGVLTYNAIGTLQGYQAGLIAALYKTMQSVFPQVYLFPARESLNVVLVATKASERYDAPRLVREGQARVRAGKVRLPTFAQRLAAFVDLPPATAARAPLLRDDYAPVEGLLGSGLRRPPPGTLVEEER
jgi:spermidine synthase